MVWSPGAVSDEFRGVSQDQGFSMDCLKWPQITNTLCNQHRRNERSSFNLVCFFFQCVYEAAMSATNYKNQCTKYPLPLKLLSVKNTTSYHWKILIYFCAPTCKINYVNIIMLTYDITMSTCNITLICNMSTSTCEIIILTYD